MIETLMLFALGFLTASLLAVVGVAFVHGRAERLTISDRSIKAAIDPDPGR